PRDRLDVDVPPADLQVVEDHVGARVAADHGERLGQCPRLPPGGPRAFDDEPQWLPEPAGVEERFHGVGKRCYRGGTDRRLGPAAGGCPRRMAPCLVDSPGSVYYPDGPPRRPPPSSRNATGRAAMLPPCDSRSRPGASLGSRPNGALTLWHV